MQQNEVFEEIKEFHRERLDKLRINETPKPCYEGGKIVLHLIPKDSFLDQYKFDISALPREAVDLLTPFYSEGLAFSRSYNFNGLLNFILAKDKKCISYVQLYRNGTIEAVDAFYLTREEKNIPIYRIEQEIILKADLYLQLQKGMGINPPIICFLALLGAKGYEITDDSIRISLEIHPFDEEDLVLPKIVIENLDEDLKKIFKTSFDRIWNACGYPRSFQYNEKGKFEPR